MSSWHSYPKIYNVGHSAISQIFLDSVIVEEKIDGSQLNVGIFSGEFRMKSKGKIQTPVPDQMFQLAFDTLKDMDWKEGWTYSGEYLAKPKHNTLAYGRTPASHFIIFDIRRDEEDYLTYEEKKAEAERLRLEVVPLLYEGKIENFEQLMAFMDMDSILGDQKIEGFVVKNHGRFGRDGKALMGKHVCELFKEKNKKDFKIRNPKQGDILILLAEMYRSEARWRKAIQRERDNGNLEHSPKDIGLLIPSIIEDVKEECEEEIKQKLFDWAWGNIKRKLTAGFPEFYKEELMKSAFEDVD